MEQDWGAAKDRLLDFMRAGGHPLEAHGTVPLAARLSTQLGKLLRFCNSTFGSITLVHPGPRYGPRR